MKRDLDMVRQILTTVADAESSVSVQELARGDDERLRKYHVDLLLEDGYLELLLGSPENGLVRLTWKGNDLLDMMETETWRAAEAISKNLWGFKPLPVIDFLVRQLLAAQWGRMKRVN